MTHVPAVKFAIYLNLSTGACSESCNFYLSIYVQVPAKKFKDLSQRVRDFYTSSEFKVCVRACVCVCVPVSVRVCV